MEEKSALRRFTDKLFGGIDLTWLKVILFAVGTAVITAVFLIVPIFKDTSFMRIGETLEAWVLFAVIIIANCKKPLESALKTFVFFLISQPLIYLLQVPFSWQGWGLFQYYKHWFILTLCTFPAAFIGWYIKKKNWLSLLILSPMLVLLELICEDAARHLIHEFPHLLITVIFCIAQMLIYLYAFTDKLSQKLIGVLVPVITAAVVLLFPKTVDFTVSEFLPDEAVLTENAVVSVEDTDIAEINISNTGKDSTVLVHVHAYGTTSFTVKDGDDEFKYSIHIYEDDLGGSKVDITVQ